jgi:hypothetical protein
MLVGRKDRKQVDVGSGIIGDFNLVAKGYTVLLVLGVDMMWSMRFETGRGKGEQRTGEEGFGNLTALTHFVLSSHGLVAALGTAGCAASEHQESVRKQGAARLLSGRTLRNYCKVPGGFQIPIVFQLSESMITDCVGPQNNAK